HHQADYRTLASAHGHADADLTRAAGNYEGEDAVQADDCQDCCQQRKSTRQEREDTFVGYAHVKLFIHGAHVEDHKVRTDASHLLAQHRHDATRIALHSGVHRHAREEFNARGEVQESLSGNLAAHVVISCVAEDSYDLSVGRRRAALS